MPDSAVEHQAAPPSSAPQPPKTAPKPKPPPKPPNDNISFTSSLPAPIDNSLSAISPSPTASDRIPPEVYPKPTTSRHLAAQSLLATTTPGGSNGKAEAETKSGYDGSPDARPTNGRVAAGPTGAGVADRSSSRAVALDNNTILPPFGGSVTLDNRRNRRRPVARKPSMKPPLPPTSSSPVAFTQQKADEVHGTTKTSGEKPELPSPMLQRPEDRLITIRKSEMAGQWSTLPRIPSIPPPSPPRDELPASLLNSSHPQMFGRLDERAKEQGSSNGDLYEYIVEERPLDFEKLTDQCSPTTSSTSTIVVAVGDPPAPGRYVPKYQKKPPAKVSPPSYYYRSRSITDLAKSKQLQQRQHHQNNYSCVGEEVLDERKDWDEMLESRRLRKTVAFHLEDEYGDCGGGEHSLSGHSDELGGSSVRSESPPTDYRHTAAGSHHQIPPSTRFASWSRNSRSLYVPGSQHPEHSTRGIFHIGAARGHGAKGARARPAVSATLDDLWRFKSEIQLNLTKKVEKMRSRVNDSARHFNNTFTVASTQIRQKTARVMEGTAHQGSPQHATQGDTAVSNDDVYGDDWSSTSGESNEGEASPSCSMGCRSEC